MVLKENGFDVVNVGKTISFESILQCIEKIKPDILFTTFIVGQKVTLLQKFCDDLFNHSKTKLFFAGNSELLRLVNTHGKVFYSLDEFDRFFNNSFFELKNIAVIGSGFAGLTSAIELASLRISSDCF